MYARKLLIRDASKVMHCFVRAHGVLVLNTAFITYTEYTEEFLQESMKSIVFF